MYNKVQYRILLLAVLIIIQTLPASVLAYVNDPLPSPPVYSYRIINCFPHDPDAFTQGLIYYAGYFYEGTGLYGHSSLRKVKLQDGAVLQQINLPPEYFGEGITLHNGRLVQLTWREHQGFVYDLNFFTLLDTFTYPTEGWGLTSDGKHLIMSDGSPTLTFLDPETYIPVKRILVTSHNRPVANLNELEYIKGQIFANIWQTDQIAIIDPDSGQVTGWLDLTGLLDPQTNKGQTVDVLNGIAYDPDGDRIFVTGKFWPRLFEIQVIGLE
ncbi:MAG: glutaminyl-peptide cyclotransferase [Firmicutes bacterium]|nr:glutaminyl-peptide cyclotransferase [Bacillota bacterium]